MKYVIGVDLGTSAVKVLLINQNGRVCLEVSRSYPLIQEKAGYSEQNPEHWVEKTEEALTELVQQFDDDVEKIEGISYSGQMHGLVLLNRDKNVLRNAILWNDTRTTRQCEKMNEWVGNKKLLDITKNPALEGFTLPKMLWVKEYEPEIYQQADVFLLPKDYLRFRMTNTIHMDYSDAAGTLLLNVGDKEWSQDICEQVGVHKSLCPPLIESHECVGRLTEAFAQRTGLSKKTKVFAGGADNACGAIGSGIISTGKTMCSMGTSGVLLSYEESKTLDFEGKVHYFNHAKKNAYYTMGVTLAAGYSLTWFKDTFAADEDFASLLRDMDQVPIGANGLLFTPYIAGERTPHADANIRGSFIGVSSHHERKHFVRSVLEGITFSLAESVEIFRDNGKKVDTIVSIGGGAKNEVWLQMQADIFDAEIVKLSSEQGPGMGAGMLAAYGAGWYSSLEECTDVFLEVANRYYPQRENVKKYQKLFRLYKQVYNQTQELNEGLQAFRM
ncbi:xylulokinase [Salinibacillus kushneri]|uniref:Xylulose kinase n=1 Tax=Salinibacillus kushneri TaxID=237682 RepID=A0A1I0GKJ9_9BACI|nr:xylulokinase [Salinibacillus kushneri]SET71686.1 xylulokinase [Salinibacillus kushneri]